MVIATGAGMTVNGGADISPFMQPVGPRATPVSIANDPSVSTTPAAYSDMAVGTSSSNDMINNYVTEITLENTNFETLRNIDQSSSDTVGIEEGQHSNDHSISYEDNSMHMMTTGELLGLLPTPSYAGVTDVSEMSFTDNSNEQFDANSSKGWTADGMEGALEALRSRTMSMSKASVTFGIPPSTLWQRAQRAGIESFKKDRPDRSWDDDSMNIALEAIRCGALSINKASKVYGIPGSTLYKNARREGVCKVTKSNKSKAPKINWSHEQLEQALQAIRNGQMSVQRAAADYGVPSGTLYNRCKRDNILLPARSSKPWSEDVMIVALEAVRSGQMKINQAATHFNLPYSSLYVRIKKEKNGTEDLSNELLFLDNDCNAMTNEGLTD